MVYAELSVLGLVLGSFANALVWRLHEQTELEEKIAKASDAPRTSRARIGKLHARMHELSIVRGRSMCPSCRHELAAKDLIPVLSWLRLRGRCRYCHQPISWQYPVVELFTAGVFVGSYVWWPLAWNAAGIFSFCLWLVFIVMFIALGVYDLRWFLLPDRIVFPLIGVAIAETILLATVFHGGFASLLQAVWGVFIVAGLFAGLYFVSRGRWIGFGDVKLAIVLGLLVGGPLNAVLLIFIASLLGSLIAIPLLVRGRVSAMTPIPFGPFLLAATAVVVLFGAHLVDWYKTFLLFP